MKFINIFCAIVFALSAPSSMFADTFFNFSFSSYQVHGQPGQPFGASGQFDTIATSTNGGFSIVGISGLLSGYPVNGDVITGLDEQNGPHGTITVSNGNLSLDAVYFLFNNGAIELYTGSYPPFFTTNTGYLATIQTNQGPYVGEVEAANLTLTQASPVAATTPEPSTFVLLATGGLGLLGAVRRRLV